MRVIVFWDSISEWFWDYENGGWVNRLKIDYWKKYWYDRMVFNYGISAYTTDNILKCFDSFFTATSKREVWKEKESVILFAIWINDSAEIITEKRKRVEITNFSQNIKTLIKKCQTEKLIQNVIFVGNINVDEKVINDTSNLWSEHFFYNKDIQEYNNVIQNLAKGTTCWYIDMFWIMDSDDLEDWLHPNAKWHSKIHEKVSKYLQRKL